MGVAELELIHQTVSRISFTNNFDSEASIELEINFRLTTERLEPSEDDEIVVRSQLHQSIQHKADDPLFSLEISLVGSFSCKGSTTDLDEELNQQVYDQLFPFMKALVARITMDAGLPPLMLTKQSLS